MHVTVTRGAEESVDSVNVSFGQDTDEDASFEFLQRVQKRLKPLTTAALGGVIGKGMEEFYQRREADLSRLEELSLTLTESNEAYRQSLEEEYRQKRATLEESLEKKTALTAEEYRAKDDALQAEWGVLEEQKKLFDDRDSRHARRDLREQLQTKLLESNESFNLSEDTNSKRKPIQLIFRMLIGFAGVSATVSLLPFTEWGGLTEPTIYHSLRATFSLIGLVAATVFYIKWNDRWFRQHSDEEFRLRRLALDIDRASWVVEIALEWQQENENEIPEYLIERLSRRLFDSSQQQEELRYPTEDALLRLLGASSEVTVPFPGGGVATLKRRALARFNKGKKEKSTKGDAVAN